MEIYPQEVLMSIKRRFPIGESISIDVSEMEKTYEKTGKVVAIDDQGKVGIEMADGKILWFDPDETGYHILEIHDGYEMHTVLPRKRKHFRPNHQRKRKKERYEDALLSDFEAFTADESDTPLKKKEVYIWKKRK